MPVNYLRTLNPTRLKLRALPKAVTRFDAILKDETLIELQERLVDVSRESEADKIRERWRRLEINGVGSGETDLFDSGIVYFKNGKRLICEGAWKEGRRVYLLVRGKEMAVSYDEAEIDMERSFGGVSGKGE